MPVNAFYMPLAYIWLTSIVVCLSVRLSVGWSVCLSMSACPSVCLLSKKKSSVGFGQNLTKNRPTSLPELPI